MDPDSLDSIGSMDLSGDLGGLSLDDISTIADTGSDVGSLALTGPVEGPTASELGIGDPANVVASTGSSSASGLGSFFSSLAGDATTILGGATASVSQAQAIQRANQLRANGYTVPLNMPGLGGSFPTGTLMLFLLIALAFYMIAK